MEKRSAFPTVFWVANSVEVLERFAYYGIYFGFGIYMASLGYTRAQLGIVQSIFLLLSYGVPVISGTFADRYGFTVLGSVIPSPSSLAGTNPADLEALATLITDTGVPAIFAETQHSSGDTNALADRVGDVEVITLETGTLDEPGSVADSYVSWLTVTARTIVDALSG